MLRVFFLFLNILGMNKLCMHLIFGSAKLEIAYVNVCGFIGKVYTTTLFVSDLV
jgi:hypothetical protein